MRYDKLLHLAAGIAIALAVGVLIRALTGASPMAAWSIALGAAVAAGVAKEAFDRMSSKAHTPDPADSIATVLGGIVGAAIGYMLIG